MDKRTAEALLPTGKHVELDTFIDMVPTPNYKRFFQELVKQPIVIELPVGKYKQPEFLKNFNLWLIREHRMSIATANLNNNRWLVGIKDLIRPTYGSTLVFEELPDCEGVPEAHAKHLTRKD